MRMHHIYVTIKIIKTLPERIVGRGWMSDSPFPDAGSFIVCLFKYFCNCKLIITH